MDLKLQLQSLQKGHLKMQAYLDKKRTLADRLRQIGSPVSDADLQLFILHGLNIEYDSLVVSLTSSSDAVYFNNFVGLLLTHEQHLNKHAMAVAGSSTPSFPASLSSSTSTSAFSSTSQANFAVSSVDPAFMEQLSAFLASKGA
jgi:gag-polypeptide of LTR copia-type